MFCPKCGAQIPDGSGYCASCGAPVGKRSQAPAASVAPTTSAGVVLKKKRGKSLLAVVLVAVAVVAIAVGALLGFGVIKLPGGPVYVMTSHAQYDSNGNVTSVTEYELDERGNAVHVSYENQSSKYGYEEEFEYDEYGNVMRGERTYQTGSQETVEYEYEYKYDERNRIVMREGGLSGLGARIEYTYYDNGALKSATMSDEHGGTLTYSYNENGFMSSYKVSTGDGVSLAEYEWELDSDGHPKSCTLTSKNRYSDDSSWVKGSELTRTFECDEHGNIVRSYDEDGNLLNEYEYTKVDNPSDNVRAVAQRTTLM